MKTIIEGTDFDIRALNAWDAWPLLQRLSEHVGGHDLSDTGSNWQLFLSFPRELVADIREALLPGNLHRVPNSLEYVPVTWDVYDRLSVMGLYLVIYHGIKVSFLDPLARDRFQCTRRGNYDPVRPESMPPVFSGILAADMTERERLNEIDLMSGAGHERDSVSAS